MRLASFLRFTLVASLALGNLVVLAATFTVSTDADGGSGSLREAIEKANLSPGPDRIHFAIGEGHQRLSPQTPLPEVVDTADIDGTTQPGYAGSPLIELDGSLLFDAESANGLVVSGMRCAIRALTIHRFLGSGLVLGGDGHAMVAGNRIGADSNGAELFGNGAYGILVMSPGNLLGGLRASDRNIISGNGDSGVLLWTEAARSNVIQGNWIGIDSQGRAPLGNTSTGVGILDAPNNLIGGNLPEAANVISGNGQFGVAILCSDAVTTGCSSTRGNRIQGNLIGTDAFGAGGGFGNGVDGVYIDGGEDTLVGGRRDAGEGNVISGNGETGISTLGSMSRGVKIQGNLIGLARDGEQGLGNGKQGVNIQSPGVTIGGNQPTQGNVIASNGEDGVAILGPNAADIRILGNLIGTDLSGMKPLGNGFAGILMESGPCNIGGRNSAERNVVSGNLSFGVQAYGLATSNLLILGNFIGTDASGETALPNGGGGILLEVTRGVTIGGDEPGSGNVISGNRGSGLILKDVSESRVIGNRIGASAVEVVPLANSQEGISIRGASRSNTIGATAARAGNLIAFNGRDGILVEGVLSDPQTNGIQNRISGNSIHSNERLGIRLGRGEPVENDPLDSDLGPNFLQNYPEITSASVAGGWIDVVGRVGSTPSSTLTIEFFNNTACDESEFGEGQTYLGTTIVQTDASGEARFEVSLLIDRGQGHFITATATDEVGNTSHFSHCHVAIVQALHIRRVGQMVELSWTSPEPDAWHLQRSDSLGLPDSWIPVQIEPTVSGPNFTVRLLLNPLAQEYYRLYHK